MFSLASLQLTALVTWHVSSYGPIFVGLVFNILLYGMMVTQTYLYFNIYSR